jgi:hypothetical protein
MTTAPERPRTRTAAPIADHQLALPGGEFALWRTSSLRGAGMPVDWIEVLADQDLWAGTTEVLAAEPVPTGRIPGRPTPEEKAARAALRKAAKERDTAYRALFEEAMLRQAATVQEFARRPLVREAVAWQNPSFARNALDSFCRAEGPGGRNSRWRQREKTIVGYLQRYCTKNDTIGFFGPVGWAEWEDSDVPLRVEPGSGLLADRTVYWESWGIDLLGEALMERYALRRHVAPRRNPSVHVDGDTVHRPYRRPLVLDAAPAAVLRACDGATSAAEIAEELCWLGAPGLTCEADVAAALAKLVKQQVVTWDLDVPLGKDPAAGLRELLERMPQGAPRTGALEELAAVEALRTAVADAAGDPAGVLAALSALDEDFTARTGQVAQRRAGETGAGRTLVFEDSRRAATARLGTGLLEDVGPALDLVLRSARWFTAAVAAEYRAELDVLFDGATPDADGRVPLSTLTFLLGPRLVGDGGKPLDGLAAELRAKWDRVLGRPEGRARWTLDSAELAARVEAEFGCEAPGWTAARYHSPDLLVAAPDAESVEPGRTLVVLGELHTALNTLEGRLFVEQHADPASMWDRVRADGVQPRVVPMLPKTWRAVSPRTYPPLTMLLPEYTYWSPGQDSGGAPGEVLPAAGLLVHRAAHGRLEVTGPGGFRADLIEVLGELISMVAVTRFGILPVRDHTPRVVVDRLVLSRESWRPRAAELLTPAKSDEATEYLETVRWLREHGVARRFFLVAPVEEKPTFIDTRSPMLVLLLARTVRRTVEQYGEDARVTLSEMLPDSDACWLRDDEGRRYVSELRVVAVDRRTPQAVRTAGDEHEGER